MAKIYRLEVSGVQQELAVLFMSTMHYQTDVPLAGSEPSVDTVLTQLQQHYSTSGTGLQVWRNATYSDCKLTKIAVREEVDPSGDDVPAEAAVDLDLTGNLTASPNSLPVPACAWVKFKTGNATRSGRGGTHLPPISSSSVLDSVGRIVSTSPPWAPYVALAAAMLDVLDDVFSSTGDIKPIIYSRTRRARGQEPFTFDLTSATVDTNVHWLRRRQTAP